MSDLNEDTKQEEIKETYETKSRNLDRVFLILVGAGLFFFFMILLPYFSIKYDSNNLSKTNWILQNTSAMITSLDEIANDTTSLQNIIQKINTDTNNIYNDLQNYLTQLESVRYLADQFNLTELSAIQQNLIPREIFTSCFKKPIRSEEWRNCNYVEKAKGVANKVKSDILSIEEPLKTTEEQIRKTNNTMIQSNSSLSSSSTNKNLEGIVSIIQDGIGKINNRLQNLSRQERDLLTVVETQKSDVSGRVQPIAFTTGTETLQNIKNLQVSQGQLKELRDSIKQQWQKINDANQNLVRRILEVDSPFGRIPVGFNELIVLFPIALAIGFLACSSLLLDTILIRKSLDRLYGKKDPPISLIAPLRTDPTNSKNVIVLQSVIFFVPSVIFAVSVVLILFVMQIDDTYPIFPVAPHINKFIYVGLYVVSSGLFVSSCLLIIRALHNYFRCDKCGKKVKEYSEHVCEMKLPSSAPDQQNA